MTPKQYEKLVKHHRLCVEADKLKKLDKSKVANRKRLAAFKQEAGMYPEEYLKRFNNCWKQKIR